MKRIISLLLISVVTLTGCDENETTDPMVSKIPGLELTSIKELPALPDIATKVQMTDPMPKILFGRVKNDCNKIVEKVQAEAAEYLKEKQPEAACKCWLIAIKQLKTAVNNASDKFSTDFFENYLWALDTCQNETLRIMSKPYMQTLSQCVKDMESKTPDWETITKSLEGVLQINPTLSQSEIESLEKQLESIRSLLGYFIKQNNRDAKVKSQRLENVLEKIDNVYIKEYKRQQVSKEDLLALSIPDAKAGERQTETVNGVEFAFRWCPPGTFMMGSPNDENNRYIDETQHKVTLTKGFWMLETEVTQKQWKAVMGKNPISFTGDDLPVEMVSWNDCQEFCKKCAKLGFHVQLPTEAQWEYACRAGTRSSYSGNLDEMAWYDFNSGVKTHPVGTKKPNAWGLYDMHGNVFEWCQDWYGEYPSGSVTDPTGSSSVAPCVYRGGSCYSDARYCRSAYRYCLVPRDRKHGLGFRVIRGQ